MVKQLSLDYITFFPTPIGQTVTPKVEVIRKINIGFRSASDLGFGSNTQMQREK